LFEGKSAINYNIVGRIVMKPKVTIIRQRVVIPATPDEVYDAFMDPKKHSEFTGSKATCSPRVGGKFTAWEGYISGKNLELEKGKKIVQEWVTTEWPQDYPPSRLELSFRDVGGNTELTMLHSDVPAEQANELEEGWTDFYWKPLKDYFKKRKPKS
jgi:activator of HSP90 ATPase